MNQVAQMAGVAMVAIYGLATNGEFRDVECTAVIASSGVIAFGWQAKPMWFRRITIAILCATAAADLYYGATRTRVYGIGPHLFFEWQDKQHIDSGFLKNMRVSGTLVEVERELTEALAANPGPYFLGPRIDFNYAAFGLPSPAGFPPNWSPATLFPLSDEARIIQRWQQQRLRTLIFVKEGLGGAIGGAYTFYPPEFMDAINRTYIRDDQSYTDLTIYRLRARD